MVSLYQKVGGYKFEKAIALTEDVQLALMERAMHIAGRAEIYLSEHRDTGDSFIEIEDGKVDRYVTLNDERGLRAALSIEFGTKHSPPTYVLSRAAYRK